MTAITVTKTSPLGCDITATLGAVTGTGMLTLANDTNTRTTTRGRWIAGTEQCGNARRQLHTATDNREISGPIHRFSDDDGVVAGLPVDRDHLLPGHLQELRGSSNP
jgi:hypothetical protein